MNETSTFNYLIRRSTTPAKSRRCTDARTIIGTVCNVMAGMLKTIVGLIVEARRRHQAYRELTQMSNPEFNDIGISRADIHAVVTGVYPRQRDLLLPISIHSKRAQPIKDTVNCSH